MTALREVGGFAPHDADDLLITILYRRQGWQGVYVPRILARGMTPVDWRGYLTQQRRWARSVLDLKFRSPATLSAATPRLTRLMSALHGLNYLQPAFFLVGGLWLLLSMLISGAMPATIAAVPVLHAALLVAAMSLCQFYRQQFFLDPVHEGGLHWRTRLLRVAKGPFLLMAIVDVMIGRQQSYVITAKVAAAGPSKHVMVGAFAPIAALILAAWVFGANANSIYPLACHLCGALAVALCLGLIASDFLPVPAPFDARLIPSAN
jgi:cellulose synthase/poly-beta-1,6-N-acetylglucosamine synthase-like glycosyltransferase